MDSLKQFALANWRRLSVWLMAGGALWLLDQIKVGLASGTIVVPADWQADVPVVLFVLTGAIAVLTPQARPSTAGAAPAGPSQPDGTPS